MEVKNNDNKVVCPKLSYEINGILFEVFKELGGGHMERYYQNAVAIGLKKKNIWFKEQHPVSLNFGGQKVGKYFLDFLVQGAEGRVVLELKRGPFIPLNAIRQTKQYLVSLNIDLGILACFTYQGVVIKRVLNLY